MSFDPPEGILDIGNATLRVGKLEVAETSGLNQGLQNIIKNDLLITENTTYTTNQKWGLKLPTTWVGEFEVKGHSGKYIDFNFYNENSASNAQGYNLTFKDTTMTLRYDNGNPLGGGAATIPTIVGAYRKVNIFFERGVISVSIDGTRYLYHKETDGFNQGLGVASRVVSTTGSAFVNLFIEQNAANSAFKNLRIVNGRFISDKTSNIAFIGGNLGVGVNSPKEALDIRGNMHFNRVSNVSSVSVDSNVVTEYTGPHDRPLRKYPEVAMTADAETASGYKGYKVTVSSLGGGDGTGYRAFDGKYADASTVWGSGDFYNSSDGDATVSGAASTTVSGVSGAVIGEWIGLQLPNKIRLQDVKIAPQSYAGTLYGPPRTPTKGVVAGSIDGTNWELVHSFTTGGISQIPLNYLSSIGPINSTKYYNYFRIIAEEIVGGTNGTRFNLEELCFYGHEEGSGSLDTTLKTVYNVPATTGTQLEVYYDGQDFSSLPATVTDKAGTATNATISNSGGTITFDSTYKAWVFGGDTTRTDTFISAALPSSFVDDQSHSVSLWFNPSYIPPVTSSFGAIFSIALATGEANSQNIQIQLNGSDTFSYVFWNNDEGFDVPMGKSIVKGQWYHLSATYEPSTGTRNIFLNGEKCVSNGVGGANPGADLDIQSGSVIKLGARQGSPPGRQEYFGSIANFRLYSKALNAGQVQELYDYQKDYFLGSKSQVTLYKGHLGVGVTEPSGQLELAGDERIQEYPPRALTGYETLVEGHGVFCASASSDLGLSYTNPYDAFSKATSVWITADNSYSSGLATNVNTFQGVNGAWLKLKLPYKINLKRFKIQGRNGSNERFIDAILYASTDDNNWDQLRSIEMPASYDYATGVDFDAPNTSKYYNYFLIQITKVQTGTGQANYANIGEWKLFGTPGPTTLDKGSLSLTRSLDVPRVSRYDVDTETPRPEKLLVDFDTTVNSSPTDISGRGNHGVFRESASYSPADKAFNLDGTNKNIRAELNNTETGNQYHSVSLWFKILSGQSSNWRNIFECGENPRSGTSDISLYILGGQDKLSFANGGGHMYSDTLTNLYFQWHHIVLTYDGANRNMYLDGALIKTLATTSWAGVANMSLTLGKNNASSAGSEGCDCHISNFKLYWQTALEPSEVKKLYNLGRTGRSTVISDTAVGIGKVPEAQLDVRGIARMENLIYGSISHRLIDEAELYYDPTRAECQDGALFATGANGAISDIKGNHPGTLSSMDRYNYFWSAQGSGSWVQTTGNIDLRRDWTIMVWFGPTTTDNLATWRILGHGQTSSNKGLHVTGSTGSTIRYGFHGNDMDAGTSTGMARKREWCCMTMSYFHNGGVAGGVDRKMYQNERLVCHQQPRFGDGSGFNPANDGGSAQANGDQPYQATPTPLRFGASYGSGNYGQIYTQIGPCLMIPRFLGDSEVRSLYRHFAGAFPAQINVG